MQDYIEHLISLGISAKHASMMARRATSISGRYSSAADAITAFAVWSETPEGVDFWVDLYRQF